MADFTEIEREQADLNAAVGTRIDTITDSINIMRTADDVAERIRQQREREPVVIPGEDAEIDERRARIARMTAHMDDIGVGIAHVYPSAFDAAQEEQAQAGRETLDAQHDIQTKRNRQEAATNARESRVKNPQQRRTKRATRLVSKARSEVVDVDA